MTDTDTQSCNILAAMQILREARAKLFALEFPLGEPFKQHDICDLVTAPRDLVLYTDREIEARMEDFDARFDAICQRNDRNRKEAA